MLASPPRPLRAAAAWLAACQLALLLPNSARAEPSRACDQRYVIAVELDPLQHVVSGRERIHFENCSGAALPALLFHLYLNAFRDRQSVFMREDGTALRDGRLGRPGNLVVTSLHSSTGQDLLAGSNAELIAHDATQLLAPLPAPLQPGAAIDLELEFRAVLPEIIARAGFARDFHMLGQWFPKLARLEESGEFAGFPYHGLGEFYADFADYDFSITLPAAYGVAASGELQSTALHADQRTDRFVARRVHDVAWAAYPHFERRTVQVGAVQVRLFAPRGYGAALERQARVLRAALPYFERRYGAYPYPGLTVVIPPQFAQRAAGMEYPALFASAGSFWALPAFAPDPEHDMVCAHELAHQWFSGMIASNEVMHPMLDEGLAQWASLDFLRTFYRTPPSLFARHAPPFELFDLVRALFLWRRSPSPSSLLPANEYRYATLGRAVYMRPAVVFEAVAERFGRGKLEAALARYAREQRFRHPVPEDLFAAFDATFGAGFAQQVLKPALEGQAPAALAPKPSAAPARGATWIPELLLLAQWLLRWVAV
jgi:hypothetical protein